MRQQVEHLVWDGIRFALRAAGDPMARVLDHRAHARGPYPVYAELRAQGPVLPSRVRGVYVATGHAEVQHVLRRHHVGVPDGVEPDPWMQWDSPLSPSLLDTDPPDHTRIRSLVAQAFTPRAIARLEERAHVVTHRLLDRAESAAGPVDLVDALAARLPITMICELLGLPDGDAHAADFRRWGADAALSLEPRRTPEDQRRIARATEALRGYFEAHVAERRRLLAADAAPDDVLTDLIRARDGDAVLSDEELLATCILLLGAGFETTVNLITNGVLALDRHPDQWAALVDAGADGVPAAVEELLRYDAPVQMTGRITWEPDEVGGVALPAGSTVLCMLGAANRDPSVFADPDDLDVGREDARRHLAFSSGAHHCIGAPLARLEAVAAFTALVERYPRLRVTGRARRLPTTVLRGLETLPVALAGATT